MVELGSWMTQLRKGVVELMVLFPPRTCGLTKAATKRAIGRKAFERELQGMLFVQRIDADRNRVTRLGRHVQQSPAARIDRG